MKTILVTGATGFVGSHTLKALSAMPDVKVIAACRSKAKMDKAFKGELRVGDIRDENYLNDLLDGVDVLVNAMAWSSLWGCEKESEELFLKPQVKLIDAYMKSNASNCVNISSTSVASPDNSADAKNPGNEQKFWPHLNNVVKIENYLKDVATKHKSVINLRLGLFAGEHYALGLLPILVPRMKTHLVPWVAGGQTGMPVLDGRDIGQAMSLAAINDSIVAYQSINVVGPTVPKVRHVIEFIAAEYNLPRPHFNVPFFIAYRFAWLMEKLNPLVPWEPLIVRSIIHLMEETDASNEKACELLGYKPKFDWKSTIRVQMSEMEQRQKEPMKMARPIA